MKAILLAGTILAAISPASAAVNTALILWNAADPGSPETATGSGSADILASSLGGINILASQANRDGLPHNGLDENNIFITNTSGTVQTLDIIAGANGYIGPNSLFSLSGTINVSLGGADLKGFYFIDSANTLNGTSEAVAGTQINSFDSGLLSGPHAFSFNGSGSDAVNTPYGMAEWLQLTLQPGAQIGVQSVSIEALSAVPEPSTWALSLLGFGLVGMAGLQRRKPARYAL